MFGKRDDSLDSFNIESIAKYVVLLINYGNIGVAYSIYKQHPKIKELIPEIDKIFDFKENIIMKVIRDIFSDFCYKMAVVFLYLRKQKRKQTDHDTFYPF